ncbi:phosphatidic acid phosphatase [Virgisporangium aliadipatigenens]|uniref:Phosphatidic acid phosphatase n=1 Tax=Virgisporangium aliadipatigenens TaxID=741659 RepID=A0A8J4DRV1_9ACTN|nr:phosphatase PAP2 family protein [Virgisporangium aliadipatigenens]GIJ47486.1 phosphatidic acid phosphatase [Virgisporangium aliadipatigenens]
MSTATSAPPNGPSLRTRRIRALALWAVGFVAWWVLLGLPATDPILAFGWLWLLTMAWRVGQPWKVHLGFARDWAPVALLLLVYNFSRGFADNGATPHAYELIWVDKWMFGGHVPTLWLQERFYDPDRLFWWDVVASWVYFSHFVVALGIAVTLWLRDRERWAKFVRRWFALCGAGLVTYFLYPAAPPWWAAKFGLLPDVARISTRGWRAIGLHGAGNVLNAGQLASNPVAAMPSLHTAFALLAVAFFFDRVRKRWWPVLCLYPLAMTATLVYCGEHYVIDVLVGWLYIGLVFVAVGLAERWWQARHPRTPEPAPPAPETDAVPASP